MASLREFFEREAGEYLERLDKLLAAGTGDPDAGEFQRLCRALRGSAQMAREGRVQDVASALESAARGLSASTLRWTADLRERVRQTLADLRVLVAADGTPDTLEERVVRAVERWREAGVEPVASPVPGASGRAVGSAEAPRSQRAPVAAAGAVDLADATSGADDFFRYAAVEVAAVVAELNAALPELEKDRRRREPIVSILRRERALLGAADLDRLGPVARVLRALDEVSRVGAQPGDEIEAHIVEFLGETRDLLMVAPPLLKRGKRPEEQPSLQHLFALRDEIIEGHAATAAPPAAEDDFPVEVVNFFRTESRTILDRIERVSRELASISEDRAGGLRDDVRSALNALRDTARTFGFAGAAAQAEHALGRVTHAAPNELREIVAGLRRAMGEPARSVEPEQEADVKEPVVSAEQSGSSPVDGGAEREAGVPSGDEAVGRRSRASEDLIGAAASGADVGASSAGGETSTGADEVEETPIMPWPEPAAQWPTGLLERSPESGEREPAAGEDRWWLRQSEAQSQAEPDGARAGAAEPGNIGPEQEPLAAAGSVEAEPAPPPLESTLPPEAAPPPESTLAPEPALPAEPEPPLEAALAPEAANGAGPALGRDADMEPEPAPESEAATEPEAPVVPEAAATSLDDRTDADDDRVGTAGLRTPELESEPAPVAWPTAWVEVDGDEMGVAEAGLAEEPGGNGGADGEPRPIEAFLYRGESAVQRADELRAELERLVDGNERARALIAELHDLVALAQP